MPDQGRACIICGRAVPDQGHACIICGRALPDHCDLKNHLQKGVTMNYGKESGPEEVWKAAKKIALWEA